jgi:5-methyltetrahydrofolate--homocysteine methyltransferase
VADLQALSQAVIVGDLESARKLTRQALDQGVDPVRVFHEALVPAMDAVGKKMKAQEYYIPEVLLAARAMKGAAEILRPLIAQNPEAQPTGRVILGTVQGDLHDIGKNLVGMMLEGAGFEVTDLGTNVSPERFVTAVKEKGANVVALSALLTTTMMRMADVIKALDAAGLRRQARVMVGGAPVTLRFATEIGADGYAPDAAGAADLGKAWVGVAS